MKIGVPKETKTQEFRVGLLPTSVTELCRRGQQVMIETNAGQMLGISDEQYKQAGAEISLNAERVYRENELIVKVKEPQMGECAWLSAGQTVFAFLHLAANSEIVHSLLASKGNAIAYEMVIDDKGRLPLLVPMSQIAGRLAVQIGAYYLQSAAGGKGILLGGIPGITPGKVIILGGGTVGSYAAKSALGLGAEVIIFDNNNQRLHELYTQFSGQVITQMVTTSALEIALKQADLVIGSVLLPGARAPQLISMDMVAAMPPNSVIIDVAIDQGGCFATSRPTTYLEPVYKAHEVLHCCITNLPGGVPRTSSVALNNVVLPYVLELAEQGITRALLQNKNLRAGLNIYQGRCVSEVVAKAGDLPFVAPEEALAG